MIDKNNQLHNYSKHDYNDYVCTDVGQMIFDKQHLQVRIFCI